MTTEEFCKTDEMLQGYYQAHIVEGYVPPAKEIILNLRFFANFSVGCSRLGVPEVAKVMSKRLESYIWMMKRAGYTSGKVYRLKWQRETLLDKCMQAAFNVRTE